MSCGGQDQEDPCILSALNRQDATTTKTVCQTFKRSLAVTQPPRLRKTLRLWVRQRLT